MHSKDKSDTRYFLEELGVNWYLRFDADMSQIPESANKVPFITVPTNASVWTSGQAAAIASISENAVAALGFPHPATIRSTASANPGSHWYIFGEANRYGFITGARFAPVFRYYYSQIKLADSSAKIIGPSVLNWEWTCLGCGGYQQGKAWLQAFIDAYESAYGAKPPVDAWAIDAYPIDWIRLPNDSLHATIVIDQLTKMRQYLNGIAEYADTPIWVTEVAVHVGYSRSDWVLKTTGEICEWFEVIQGRCELTRPDAFHWDKISDYLTTVLDWLEDNAAAQNIEKWFFFKTWKDVANPGPDFYMGISFFDDPTQGASRTCLGDIYRARSLGDPDVACDAAGNTVLDP